ncbi:hypothetical protein LZ32DRAFT_608827 [Colletotrichum eremochloae]|nr:hypothetical protein LZ32DRAFT_608827 [Colletotrichum eremochloae]
MWTASSEHGVPKVDSRQDCLVVTRVEIACSSKFSRYTSSGCCSITSPPRIGATAYDEITTLFAIPSVCFCDYFTIHLAIYLPITSK